jgi:hypothetical protein
MKTNDQILLEASYDQVRGAKPSNLDKLSRAERNGLYSGLKNAGLDGNGRFESAARGLQAAHSVFAANGFVLDATSAIHSSAGSQGSVNLTFRRKLAEGADPFTEGTEIVDSKYVFNWYEVSTGKYEVQTYVS